MGNEDECKTSWVVWFVLFILMFACGSVYAKQKHLAAQQEQLLIDLGQTAKLSYDNDVLQGDILKSQYNINMQLAEQIAYVWIATSGNQSLFDNFGFHMLKDMDCKNTDLKSIRVHNSFFGYEGKIGDFLIYQFKDGYLVFQRNGKITCYSDPVLSMKPEPVVCKTICNNPGVGEVSLK